MNDMINNISSTKPVGFQTLVNGWVENLTANTALINKLFAKQITLQSGGEIKSSNWSQGFKLSDDGTVEFYKGSIGESVEIGRTHICSSNQGLVICKGNVTYEKIKNIIIGNANADNFGTDAQRNIIITNYFSILQNATDNVLIGHTVYTTNKQHKNVVIGNNNNLGSNNEVEENILIGYNLNPNWGYRWKHNINLGNRFVYYEFDSTATHDTVYSELGRILSVSRNDSFLITCIASSSLTVTIQPPQSSSYSVLVYINTIRKDAGSSILYLGQYSMSDDYKYKIYGGNSTQLGGNVRIAFLPDTDAYTITNH